MPQGYYSMESIFLLLACLALARVPSLEQLRYQSPGEWGKLLGLDRIPEVKTLREKLGVLGDDPGKVADWSAALARDWMENDVESAGVLLIDGHTRLYHGQATALPRRYIACEKLCLRATTDYWVNAMDGAPFFCVTKAVDPGLQKALEEEIVPRLLREVPGQPDAEALAAEPLRHRFTLIFDREGYSPALFARLKTQRIAVLTYHKHPGADWPAEEFRALESAGPSGESILLRLAERGVRLSNGLWVRELRSLNESGRQTSILSADYLNDLLPSAMAMFARWHQENFFKYMREHYGLDKLVEHGISPLPETTRLVNPQWRCLESQIRSKVGQLNRKRTLFAAKSLEKEDSSPQRAARHELSKGQDLADIQARAAEIVTLKARKKATARHVMLKELPPEQQASQLPAGRKLMVNTIKLIAYRAETALVGIVRETIKRLDDARSLVRSVFKTAANLRPDRENGALEIQLHGQANCIHDAALSAPCHELNATETSYPGTDLRLKYLPLRSSSFQGLQDV